MRKLSILMCCQFPLTAKLGGPKGYLEVAETYRRLGHDVNIVGIQDIVPLGSPYENEQWRIDHFPNHLKKYILAHHGNYDVIEYEAVYLPFDLNRDVSSILVARNVLLELHFKNITLPRFPGLKPALSHLIRGPWRRFRLHQRIRQSLRGMMYADLVNVSNFSDEQELVRHGVSKDKIVVQPYGISEERYKSFQEARRNRVKKEIIRIGFVGTFDKRKGAVDFLTIIRAVATQRPNVRFHFMGVLGMFSSEQKIREFIGEELSPFVEITEKYAPSELPELLSQCDMGIFPSHLESFGFGVLEMMASGLPVVGYNVPGLDLLIEPRLLVERGDADGVAKLLLALSQDESLMKDLSESSSRRASRFIYESQPNHSVKKYLELKEKTEMS